MTKNLPQPPSTSDTLSASDLQKEKILAGQRQINIIWEVTQAIIAITVTVGVVIVAVHNGLSSNPSEEAEFPPVLANAFFLIVGFYYSRTNHQSIGGIGPKANAEQEYKGR